MSLQTLKSRSLAITLAALTVTSVLTGCASNQSESVEDSAVAYFDNSKYMQQLKQNRSNCELEYVTTARQPINWQSKKMSEVEKYTWVEYNEFHDYYDFYLEDPAYEVYDAERVTRTQKCVDFLTGQISELNVYEDQEATKLIDLYNELLSNRTNYLTQAQALDAVQINKANRAKYLEIEDAKRTLTSAKELIFIEIRKLIDYTYYGSVKVYIERCPDAYSIFGNDTYNDGSVLLVNTSSSSSQVDLTVRFTDDEDVIVGDWGIYEDVPGNAKIRVDISAAGASGAVTGGVMYPPRCSIS